MCPALSAWWLHPRRRLLRLLCLRGHVRVQSNQLWLASWGSTWKRHQTHSLLSCTDCTKNLASNFRTADANFLSQVLVAKLSSKDLIDGIKALVVERVFELAGSQL